MKKKPYTVLPIMILYLCLIMLLNQGCYGTIAESHECQKQATFVQKLERGEKVRLGALGTSLTGGDTPWFDVMKEWFNKDYPAQLEYLNLGISASASSYPPGESGLAMVNEMIKFNPDVVFIEFAVNDAYEPYQISMEESRHNLEAMINSLKSSNPEVEIIVQTMNVVIDMPELDMSESTKRSALADYYGVYRQVAADMGLLLIDHYPNWQNLLRSKGRELFIQYVPDGIHPNYEGYRKIVIPELQKYFKS
ncbi:MAG: SGNH/GDSL hydrolase family protein [Marinilabiliaceae bacterium]|nr:SGNH/GDSL hydrolase family protein [Marinilabiliaceae bacterium]